MIHQSVLQNGQGLGAVQAFSGVEDGTGALAGSQSFNPYLATVGGIGGLLSGLVAAHLINEWTPTGKNKRNATLVSRGVTATSTAGWAYASGRDSGGILPVAIAPWALAFLLGLAAVGNGMVKDTMAGR